MCPSAEHYDELVKNAGECYETMQQWKNAKTPDHKDQFYCQIETPTGIVLHGWIFCSCDLDSYAYSFGEAILHIPYQQITGPPPVSVWVNENAGFLLDQNHRINLKALGENFKFNQKYSTNNDEITFTRRSKTWGTKKGDEEITIARIVDRAAWRPAAKNKFKDPSECKIASMLGCIETFKSALDIEVTPVCASIFESALQQ